MSGMFPNEPYSPFDINFDGPDDCRHPKHGSCESCHKERVSDQRTAHTIRGTTPVWFIRTEEGYCVVAAENDFQAREATKKVCIAWKILDGVFFNGAGPRLIEELR